MDQRSEDWFSARMGCATASRITDIMAKTKSGPSATRTNYMAQLVTERLTGERENSFCSPAMQRGTELEPQARAMYEIQTGQSVCEVGFIKHPNIDRAGASPDGLVGNGLVEFKVPNSSTHLATLLGKKIDRRYLLQMQFQMACCPETQWCDFVSFDPRLTPAKQYFCKRIQRDEELIAEIEAEVRTFLAEIDETLARLEAEYPEKKEAA